MPPRARPRGAFALLGHGGGAELVEGVRSPRPEKDEAFELLARVVTRVKRCAGRRKSVVPRLLARPVDWEPWTRRIVLATADEPVEMAAR